MDYRKVEAVYEHMEFRNRRAKNTTALLKGSTADTIIVTGSSSGVKRATETECKRLGVEFYKIVGVDQFDERMIGLRSPVIFDWTAVAEIIESCRHHVRQVSLAMQEKRHALEHGGNWED